ncbi:MAG: phage integrase SAM-like domain-containing protein [Akkermansia sp.]|nr:phage integrase SAM-like domain-containing protein [Akkermansia sp.]
MSKDFYKGRLSINKEKTSPYWMVSFQGPDGKMRRRSTKVPVAGGMFEGVKITAKLAEKLAYQRGVQMACAAETEYESHNNISVRDWCEGYISRNAGRISARTVNNARTAYKFLYTFLGSRASAPMRLLTKADIKNFVATRREQVRAETVKKDLAAISQACKDAVDAEIIDKNPCQGVSIPADRAGEKRIKEAFTLEEIRYMIDKFPPQWSSAVRCSFETFGQRLGDILRLDWSQFDWNARVVRFVTGKTGRVLAQPMRDGFYTWAYAEWQKAGCPESGLLHPDLLPLGDGASYQFGTLLRTHGIGLLHGSFGGRRRVMNSKSFHSIRATCATLLHASGVSQGMAMELVGHDSQDVHSVYIRPTSDQLRDAANALPSI